MIIVKSCGKTHMVCFNSDDVKAVLSQQPPGVANFPVDMVLHLNCSGVRCPVSETFHKEYGSPFLGTSKTTLYFGCPPHVKVALNRLVSHCFP